LAIIKEKDLMRELSSFFGGQFYYVSIIAYHGRTVFGV